MIDHMINHNYFYVILLKLLVNHWYSSYSRFFFEKIL